jgi:carboxyl-terminal processing protease
VPALSNLELARHMSISRLPKLLAAVILAAGCWLAPAPAVHAEAPAAAVRSQASTLAEIDLTRLFDAVVETIGQRFVDAELLKTIDWQERAKAVRHPVISAATLDEAVGRINQLIAELKTSHTGLYGPDDFRYYITLDALRGAGGTSDLIAERFWGTGPYFPGIGAFTAVVNGRHFIDGILEGSPADKAGLKFGDEVLSVDGHPYRPIASFRGSIGRTVTLEIRRTRDAEVTRYDVAVIPLVPSVAFSNATRASARVIEKNGNRIGYIHVWALGEARTFRAALDALHPASGDSGLDALIVDMRGRVGGSVGVAGQLLDMLSSAQKPYWGALRFIDRSGKETNADGRSGSGPTARPFLGRSTILIDHQTRSAGEIMAYGYQHSGFGTVIGTRTAGAVTSGSPHAMPGGLMLYVATSSLEFDGKRLEGTGVSPDVRIERPLPYAAGADPVLDAAVDRLAGHGPAVK